jgi:hypothetical protein
MSAEETKTYYMVYKAIPRGCDEEPTRLPVTFRVKEAEAVALAEFMNAKMMETFYLEFLVGRKSKNNKGGVSKLKKQFNNPKNRKEFNAYFAKQKMAYLYQVGVAHVGPDVEENNETGL